MSPRLRLAVPVLLVVGVLGAAVLLTSRPGDQPSASSNGSGGTGPGGSGVAVEPTILPSPTPIPPIGGTELFGFLPYWQMTESVASYLEAVPMSTLAVFSVSAKRNGSIDTSGPGYRKITSELGRAIIAGAKRRRARVELVFTSFGTRKNGIFFGRIAAPTSSPGPIPAPAATSSPSSGPTSSPGPTTSPEAPWERTIGPLVDLAVDLGVDGINVDVEQLDEVDRPAYGEFLGALRTKLVAAIPKATLSADTEAGSGAADKALAAWTAGVDRVFLMGYDYHWSGSAPGASSPVDRLDGEHTLRWSIDQYVEAGVPRDRILLGLPLYGMTWKTAGPDRTTPVIGRGATWIPSKHLDVLLDPAFVPTRDPLEVAEYFVRAEGDAWRLTYYDSPATLRTKLALARDQGLAGGGFWAVGYERGLPGYDALLRDFRAGKVERSEAPPAPPVP